MIRLTIIDKPEVNWFKQAFFLKKNLNLSLWECIRLLYHLKRDKDVLIQSCKNERVINNRLETQFFVLKECFKTKLDDVPYNFTMFLSPRHYDNIISDYKRGIKVFVTKL